MASAEVTVIPASCTVGVGERTQPTLHADALGPNASTFTFMPREFLFRVARTITCTMFVDFVPDNRTERFNARAEY
jgi:hypothetical protein